jgi:hypothetical protein
MSDFSVGWDAQSLKIIQDMGYADILMTGAIQAGLGNSADVMIAAMQRLMGERFKNPSGQLASSLYQVEDSPYEVTIGSDLPYVWRRDAGFSGMTDSLGRFYADDPGIYYAEDGMNESLDEVSARMTAMIEQALQRMGGR